MLNPFTLYCSPGIYKFDEDYTFGMTVIDESAVQDYMETGKWFLNSRDAVDAFIRGQESAEDVESEEGGSEEGGSDEGNDDNETGNNKRRARRSRNKSGDV